MPQPAQPTLRASVQADRLTGVHGPFGEGIWVTGRPRFSPAILALQRNRCQFFPAELFYLDTNDPNRDTSGLSCCISKH